MEIHKLFRLYLSRRLDQTQVRHQIRIDRGPGVYVLFTLGTRKISMFDIPTPKVLGRFMDAVIVLRAVEMC